MKKLLVNALGCLALLALASNANAQVVFDDDSGDGTWENAVNWSGDALPGATDNAQIHSATASLTSSQSVTDFTAASDGAAAGSIATVNHSAGTLSGAGTSWSKIGTDGNTGTYNMSGTAAFTNFDVFALGINGGIGTLNLSSNASLATNSGVALGGTTSVNQTGGTFTSGAWLGISNFGGGTVNYNISDGSVISNGDWFSVGEDGVGNLNVSGSADVQANGLGMIVSRNAGAAGTVNIDGSTSTFTVNDLRVAIDQDGTDQGNAATMNWTADAAGVTTIFSADNTEFGAGAVLNVDLTADANFSSWTTTPMGSLMDIAVLIDNANAVTGTFSGAAEGSLVSIGGGQSAFITYVGGDGNDIVLQAYSAIPEPASAGFLTLLVGAAAIRRRRR